MTFQLTALISADDLASQAMEYDPALHHPLSLGSFEHPVSLLVNDMEFFLHERGSLLSISLVHAAANFYFCLRAAQARGECSFDLGLYGQEPIVLTMVAHDEVRLSRSDLGIHASVEISTALASALEFLHEIRRELLEACPSLVNDCTWADWFAGDDLAGRSTL